MADVKKDFKELNFKEVDFNSGNWSFCSTSGRFSIYSLDEDLNKISYDLPDCISEMLRMQWDCGKDEARQKMRSALGV